MEKTNKERILEVKMLQLWRIMTNKVRRCDNRCKSKMSKFINKLSKCNVYYKTYIFSLSCQLLVHWLPQWMKLTTMLTMLRLIVLITCQRIIDSWLLFILVWLCHVSFEFELYKLWHCILLNFENFEFALYQSLNSNCSYSYIYTSRISTFIYKFDYIV